MAASLSPKPVLKLLQGYCPSCDKSTALAILFNQGMPTTGAFQVRSQCISCGSIRDLPPIGSIGFKGSRPSGAKGRGQRKTKI